MNNNMKAIIGSSFISYLGNGMQFIALSWYITQNYREPKYIGFLLLIGSSTSILCSPISGYLADTKDNKLVIIASDFIRCIVLLLIILVDIDNKYLFLTFIYTINAILDAGSTIFHPSFIGAIKNHFNDDEYLTITSYNSTALQLGAILGATIAGVIIASFGIKVVFLMNSISYLLSAVLLLKIKKTKINNKKDELNYKKVNFIENVNEGYKVFFSNTIILYLLFLGVLSSLSVKVINTFLSGYTFQVLESNSKVFGILDAFFAIGAVILGLVFAMKKKGTFKSMWFFLFLMGLMYVTLSISNSVLIAMIAMFILGGTSIIFSNIRKTYFFKIVDKDIIGRIESINSLVFSVLTPFLSFILASLTTQNTIQNTFLWFGFLYMILAIPIFKLNSKLNIKSA